MYSLRKLNYIGLVLCKENLIVQSLIIFSQFILLMLFALYMAEVKIPIPYYSQRRIKFVKYRLFGQFPVGLKFKFSLLYSMVHDLVPYFHRNLLHGRFSYESTESPGPR